MVGFDYNLDPVSTNPPGRNIPQTTLAIIIIHLRYGDK